MHTSLPAALHIACNSKGHPCEVTLPGLVKEPFSLSCCQYGTLLADWMAGWTWGTVSGFLRLPKAATCLAWICTNLRTRQKRTFRPCATDLFNSLPRFAVSLKRLQLNWLDLFLLGTLFTVGGWLWPDSRSRGQKTVVFTMQTCSCFLLKNGNWRGPTQSCRIEIKDYWVLMPRLVHGTCKASCRTQTMAIKMVA